MKKINYNGKKYVYEKSISEHICENIYRMKFFLKGKCILKFDIEI